MMKKTVLALFGLVLAFALVAPQKASAQVSVGIGIGVRPAYGYVVAPPPPPPPAYVYPAAPYAAYAPEYYPYGYSTVVVGRGYGWGHYGWHGYPYGGHYYAGHGYGYGRGYGGWGEHRR